MIPAVHNWSTNAHLIADVASLYPIDGLVLDATYGRGAWWEIWSPKILLRNDLDPESLAEHHEDFRHLPFPTHHFDTVAFDPPYKLNGTPALGDFDDRYGIGATTPWRDRMELILDGFEECSRVITPHGWILAKCQDQVVSGRIRWQTLALIDLADTLGVHLIDRFDMLRTPRPQPKGRRQVHAHGRPSTLLVFRRG